MGRRLGRAWPSTYRPLTLRYRYGLHTAARDAGSVMIAEHVRVERCGQRGVTGKH